MKKFLSKLLFRDAPGKLPEDLPLPVDPVSGKTMKYFHGDVVIENEIFQSGKNQLDKKDVTVRGRKLMFPSEEKGVERKSVIIPDRRII